MDGWTWGWWTARGSQPRTEAARPGHEASRDLCCFARSRRTLLEFESRSRQRLGEQMQSGDGMTAVGSTRMRGKAHRGPGISLSSIDPETLRIATASAPASVPSIETRIRPSGHLTTASSRCLDFADTRGPGRRRRASRRDRQEEADGRKRIRSGGDVLADYRLIEFVGDDFVDLCLAG